MFVESLYATNEKEREKENDSLINISMHHNCYYAVIIEKKLIVIQHYVNCMVKNVYEVGHLVV